MEQIIIGIDPGKTGAIAFLYNCGPVVYDMPVGSDKRVDSRELFNLLSYSYEGQDYNKTMCFLEKSQALPKQGVTSTFNYGVTYGAILACLQIASIPFQEIQPQRWKKEFTLIKKDKKESVAAATRLFPSMENELKRKKKRGEGFIYNDGRAEALLIAEFCRRTCNA